MEQAQNSRLNIKSMLICGIIIAITAFEVIIILQNAGLLDY